MFLVSRALQLAIPLHKLPLEIGRSGKCDVVIERDRISRHHLRIDRVDGLLQIRDDGNRNLTRLNGTVITSEGWKPIELHDRVTLADCALEVLDTGQAFLTDDAKQHVGAGNVDQPAVQRLKKHAGKAC